MLLKKRILSLALLCALLLAQFAPLSALAAGTDAAHKHPIDTSLSALAELTKSGVDTYWDAWSIIDLSVNGTPLSEAQQVRYKTWVGEQLAAKKWDKDTNAVSRHVIALSSLGIDATAIPLADGNTQDLIAKIGNSQNSAGKPTEMTAAGYAFALSAYNAGEYADPTAHFTRAVLIEELLKLRTDGHWDGASWAKPGDVDTTAMAVASLAPYYDTNKDVKAAIDVALNYMSTEQQENGAYLNYGSANSNSCSVVIVALAALGIDADTDPRFVKNGKSVLDALFSYQSENMEFGFQDTTPNGFASEQAFRALLAYQGQQKTQAPFNLYIFSGKPPQNVKVPIVDTDTAITENLGSRDKVTLTTTTTAVGETVKTTLPKVDVSYESAKGKVELSMPKDVTITAPKGWNGDIDLPTLVPQSLKDKTVSIAIKVGGNVDLTFDKPVRLLIPNAAGQKIGFINTAGVFKEISNTLTANTAAALGTAQEGKIAVGADVAIWTRHFTSFVAYEDKKVPDGGGGGTVTPDTLDVRVQVTGFQGKSIVASQDVSVPKGSTVWTALKQVLDAERIPYTNTSGGYISSVDDLAELEKGPRSGWIYEIAGKQPSLAVNAYTLKGGEKIHLKYTVDYTAESSGPQVTPPPEAEIPPSKYKKGERVTSKLPSGLSAAEKLSYVPSLKTAKGETLIAMSAVQGDSLVFTAPQDGDYVFALRTKSFADIDKHWAADSVRFITARGLFLGTDEKSFSPEASMTRGMFATVLARLDGADLSEHKTTSFSDVSMSRFDGAPIAWASTLGLLQGDGAGKFMPDAAITREQMATILQKYIALRKLPCKVTTTETAFTDAAAISPWALSAVQEMQTLGILRGTQTGAFMPEDPATRAAVAQIFMNLITSAVQA